MKIAVFSSKAYDQQYFGNDCDSGFTMTFFETRLNAHTAVTAQGFEVVCCFVNDDLSEATIKVLKEVGVKLIALRCAGFNNLDLQAAQQAGITVCRVPAYSPHSVAEHALALLLSLNRNIHRAFNRVRENDYSLNGLLGFDLYKKKVAVIGTGKIGSTFARIMTGLGCEVIACDPVQDSELIKLGVSYVTLEHLWHQADIISLHCPLQQDTFHLVNEQAISQMKPGVALINTGRGALIDTKAVISGLKSGHIGYLGLDVYEEEADLFFEDKSNTLLQDDVFARLLTFPNVLITGHQGFFTKEALTAIAQTTMANIRAFAAGDFAAMQLVGK
ncbi:2-hydroxyacid dehydrogenase [Thalassomonas actiniarum]|uniref:2-hydroxyacid dehydrogenase n=1 Tax=Thalassomonas actiniarum TaxID=485447 RepID=A0AAF0BWB1_9GAMM|nr:2-hydroxyacid dehydrogenase [Thalassomonas actiniarum]WDD96576.1 2-hydroxyacid dehydrogenase [Thalassomonas actiniarum]